MQSALESIIARHPATHLEPVCFFVARSGVLTLAYEGFCSSLLNIKAELETELPDLSPERPGSKWPKTSLGALRTGVNLSKDEIEDLHKLCLDWDTRVRTSGHQLDIDRLHLITYQCRSLERRRASVSFRLSTEEGTESSHTPDWHLKDVDDVLAQFNIENLDEYSAEIQRAGNHEDHYREDSCGTTLVYAFRGDQLPFIASFTDQVEKLLPARYAWFAPDSMHVTVRHLSEQAIPLTLHSESR